MHPLVPAVLLWVAGLDALEANAEPNPLHRELRQAARGTRCERTTIVGTNGRRQPELSECGLEDAGGGRSLRRRERLAAKQVAAERVGDRKRVAAPIVDGKVTLEVGTPHVVWRAT